MLVLGAVSVIDMLDRLFFCDIEIKKEKGSRDIIFKTKHCNSQEMPQIKSTKLLPKKMK